MRWPRFRRRRTPPPAALPTAPTFHHETRILDTRDGPMIVQAPILDDPSAMYGDALSGGHEIGQPPKPRPRRFLPG